MLATSFWGAFGIGVAVTVVGGLALALLLGAGNSLRKSIRDQRTRPKRNPPDVDLSSLGERQRVHVQALLHEREGYVARGLRDRVEQVDEQIVKARDEWWEKANDLRVALINIRSELESARRLLQEASERQLFWEPEQEELPAARWDDYRELLAGESEVEESRAAVEAAYQDCNRLNQLVRERIRVDRAEREASPRLMHRRPADWGRSFDAMENDADKVQSGITDIDTATAAIEVSLKKL